MRDAGGGAVLGKPARPPFGQFSVWVKWTLKEAAELDPRCRTPTQRVAKGCGGGTVVRELERSERSGPCSCPENHTRAIVKAPATHGARGGRQRGI